MRIKFTAALAALFFFSAHVFAQTQSARLVGTVHDASGAAIPNAKITATQQETKKTTETTTNTSGDYVSSRVTAGHLLACGGGGRIPQSGDRRRSSWTPRRT